MSNRRKSKPRLIPGCLGKFAGPGAPAFKEGPGFTGAGPRPSKKGRVLPGPRPSKNSRGLPGPGPRSITSHNPGWVACSCCNAACRASRRPTHQCNTLTGSKCSQNKSFLRRSCSYSWLIYMQPHNSGSTSFAGHLYA